MDADSFGAIDDGAEPTLWGLDAMFFAEAKLLIGDIHNLEQIDGVADSHSFRGHPVDRVSVLGYIVHVKRYGSFIKYGIDDGTGCIFGVFWTNSQAAGCRSSISTLLRAEDFEKKNEEDFLFQIGDLVSAIGRLSIYRGCREISLNRIQLETDPNAESLHWAQTYRLYTEVYIKPCPITSQVLEKTKSDANSNLLEMTQEPEPVLPWTKFIDSCLAIFRAKGGSCRFIDIVSINNLVSMASELSASSSAMPLPSVRTHQTDLIFQRAFKQLVSEGKILQTNAEADEYSLVDIDKHVVPLLVSVLSSEPDRDFTFEQIRYKLEYDMHRSGVGDENIQLALQRVLAQGQVWMSSLHSFRWIR